MQIKDFLGLQMPFICARALFAKVGALFMALPTVNIGDAAIGVVTLGNVDFLAASRYSSARHLPRWLVAP